MPLTTEQQFQELISKSNNILVCFSGQGAPSSGGNFSGDAVAGALALGNFLKKQGKRFNIAASDFQISSELSFLPGVNEIQDKLINLRQFIIALNLQDKKIDEFSYDLKDNQLQVYILPQEGNFSQEDITVHNSAYRFDCIITLDTPELESLGKMYSGQPEFFFHTPIINIDHNISNENYGQLNLVDLTTSSVSEILYHLMQQIDPSLIDEPMATLLLAGMISKTQSFKAPNITPQTLRAASDLINQGAEREKIITHFYRTRTLPALKLWGRVLARLQHDKYLKLVWSAVPHTDFVKSGAEEKDIKGVAEEIIANSPQAEIILLLYEKSNHEISGQLHASENHDAKYLLNNFEISGNKTFVTFAIKDKSLSEVEAEAVNEIRSKLEK